MRSTDDRRLAAALLDLDCVFGVELDGKSLVVRTSDLGDFTSNMPRVARDQGISLHELRPTDDSLESVFAYLVGR